MGKFLFSLFVLAMVSFARAVEPSSSPAASPAKPAEPVKKVPQREEMKPVFVARKFLQLLAESKDKDAYEQFTTDEYRKEHSLDDFTGEANIVRESQLEPGVIPTVEGWVLIKPTPGEPKVATLRTRQMNAMGKSRKRQLLGMNLVESADHGHWRVAELRKLEYGKEAWDYVEDTIYAARRGGGAGKPVSSNVSERLPT